MKSVQLSALLSFALLVMHQLRPSEGCLCLLLGNAFKCPQPPTCCESGQYALDECGCCKKCAKAELQSCGGASDISGRCGRGLQCLKECLPCTTVGAAKLPCIFPFKYDNHTYTKCTTKDSDYGQPWCATAIDSDGYVIDNAWGDCSEGCPGTRVECDDRYFSIQEGKCIDVSVPGAIPNWVGAPVVKLEPPTETLFPAPICQRKAVERYYENTCRCARGETALDFDLNGVPRGNCTGLEDDEGDNLDKVWCFLENVRDPSNPKSGCYSDTEWSTKDGRYWSALACREEPDYQEGQYLGPGKETFNAIPSLPSGVLRPVAGPTKAPRFRTTTFSPVKIGQDDLTTDRFYDDSNQIDYAYDYDSEYGLDYSYNEVQEPQEEVRATAQIEPFSRTISVTEALPAAYDVVYDESDPGDFSFQRPATDRPEVDFTADLAPVSRQRSTTSTPVEEYFGNEDDIFNVAGERAPQYDDEYAENEPAAQPTTLRSGTTNINI